METIVVMVLVAVIFAPLWFVTVCVWVCMFVTTVVVVVAVDTSTKWWLPGPRKNNECARVAGPHLHNKHTGSTTLFPSSGTRQSREQNKTTQRKRKRNKKSASRVSVCDFVFLCVSVCVCANDYHWDLRQVRLRCSSCTSGSGHSRCLRAGSGSTSRTPSRTPDWTDSRCRCTGGHILERAKKGKRKRKLGLRIIKDCCFGVALARSLDDD